MKKEEMTSASAEEHTNVLNNAIVGIVVFVAVFALVLLVRYRRNKMKE